MDHKWYAALAYVRANRLNHNVIEGPNDRFGIIASGKGYNDTRQALHDLGLDDATCRRIGLRLHKVNVVWPLEATITRDFAEGLQEILVVEEKRQVIEYQLKEQLYGWRPDVRPQVLGKFDESEGDSAGGEWSQANPSQHWLLRAQADLTPAIIAKAIAKRLGKLGVDADILAGMAMRIGAPRRQGEEPGRPDAQLHRRQRDRRARAVVLQRLPAQHVDQGARRIARRRRHRLPLHGGLDGSLDGQLQPDGRRRRVVGRPGAVHDREPHLRQPRRRHLLSLGPARGAPVDRRQGQHHLQDPLQRRRRDDRRPAGRRHDEGARDDARARRRRRGQGRRRHRRAREVRRARDPRPARAERHGPPPRRARRGAEGIARDPRLHGHRLRPDLRDREAPAQEARHDGRPGQARRHQRAGVRRLRRLLGAEQLPVGRAGRDRVRPQAPHQPEHLQQGLFVPEGLLPELRHRRRRPAEEHEEGRRRAASPRRRARAAGAGAAARREALGHRRRRRRRHRRDHDRPAARHGGAPRGQGHRHAGFGRPRAKGRRDLEPRPDREPARGRSSRPRSAPPRPTS